MLRHPILLPLLATVLLWGCTKAGQDTRGVGNKAVVQEWIRDNDRITPATIDQIFDKWIAPDMKAYPPGASAPIDRAGYKDQVAPFLAAFGEFRTDINQLVAEGDVVVAALTVRMKHTGMFAGMAPTGRVVVFDEIAIVTVRNGKIAEERFVFDSGALERQLKEATPPAAAPATR